MTIPFEKKIIHLGWPIAGSILLAVFGAGMWGQKFLEKQDRIYDAVMQHGIILDSVKQWHVNGLAHRSKIDLQVTQMGDKVDVLWDAYSGRGEATFTERKVNGKVIFEKVQTTK